MSSLQCAASLTLARHGESHYESAAWSDEGGTLTRRGRDQALQLARGLVDRRVAHVWASSHSRAVETAHIAAAELNVGVSTHDGLREFPVGDFAGTPRTDDPFATTYARWIAGEVDVRLPGSETAAEIIARVRRALEEIADTHRGESVLVISHGGALRLAVPAVAAMTGITPVRLTNCATIELAIDSDDWACRSWGDLPEPLTR